MLCLCPSFVTYCATSALVIIAFLSLVQNSLSTPTKLTSANSSDDGQLAKASEIISYDIKWFEQPVDHFSFVNQDTWLQRYFVNKDHCKQTNCPILFYVSGDDIDKLAKDAGFLWENLEILNAMIIFVEHRFYGKSMPHEFNSKFISRQKLNKILGYLSAEQALADYAKLIYSLKKKIYFNLKNSPVIILGGSYGGMLATWMRIKYSHLVIGALASSAPVLHFPGDYDCRNIPQIVTRNFENYSTNCSKSIAKSWSVLKRFANFDGDNLIKLSKYFNTCKQMKFDDVSILRSHLIDIWIYMAMSDYSNEATILTKMPAYPIKYACEQLNVDPFDDNDNDNLLLQRISLASQVFSNYSKQVECLNLDESSIYGQMATVAWNFQSCTEMVMPTCSIGTNSIFEPMIFSLKLYAEDCRLRYGVSTQANRIRTFYGIQNGDKLAASNIIFSLGTRDPWSAGCVNKGNEKNEIYALKIEGACHCEDLLQSGPNDSESLKQVRAQELSIISNWLEKYYKQLTLH